MSDLEHDAWPHDKALPEADSLALDDQAALAIEIAAMRVRASWDELDAPPEVAPTPLAAAPVDPFAPIIVPEPAVPAWSPSPVSALAPESALRPAASASLPPQPFDLATPAPLAFASEVSPSSVVDTAPMAFLVATPAAVSGGKVSTSSSAFDDALPAPTFLPGNKLASPTVIAVVVVTLLAGTLWLLGGSDSPTEAASESAPSGPSALNTPPARVEIPRLPPMAGVSRSPRPPPRHKKCAWPRCSRPLRLQRPSRSNARRLQRRWRQSCSHWWRRPSRWNPPLITTASRPNRAATSGARRRAHNRARNVTKAWPARGRPSTKSRLPSRRPRPPTQPSARARAS